MRISYCMPKAGYPESNISNAAIVKAELYNCCIFPGKLRMKLQINVTPGRQDPYLFLPRLSQWRRTQVPDLFQHYCSFSCDSPGFSHLSGRKARRKQLLIPGLIRTEQSAQITQLPQQIRRNKKEALLRSQERSGACSSCC